MLLELLVQHTILFLRDVVTKQIQGRATDPLSSSVHNMGENTAVMSLEAEALLGIVENCTNYKYFFPLVTAERDHEKSFTKTVDFKTANSCVLSSGKKDLRPTVISVMIHSTPGLWEHKNEEKNLGAVNHGSFCTFNYRMPVKSKEKQLGDSRF